MENNDEKLDEKLKLLKHVFYFSDIGENEALKFLNEKLEATGIKKVNTFQEAAYILTDNELESVINGISVVNPFKGRFYTFKNRHLYYQQDSADKILAEIDRAIRIYGVKAWVIIKTLMMIEKLDLPSLRQNVSQVINTNIDYHQLLGELQNNYHILNAIIEKNKIYWKISSEIKPIIRKQIDQYEKYKELLEKFPEISEDEKTADEKTEGVEISLKPKRKGETFIDLTEVLDLIKEDKVPVAMETELKEPKKVKKKIEKSQIEGRSITVDGNIKKILKNDITFKTADGQEVRFTCNRPEIIAYCIGNINKQLRFYFDVKASELVCQKVEVSE